MADVNDERRSEDRMHDNVASFARRRRRFLAERGRTLALALAVIGIGWAIALPAVLGFAIGHWLDARYGTGVVLAAGLGFLGLAIGCYSAYLQIRRQR